MNNLGWFRNDISLHKISSFSYQTSVTVKFHVWDNESQEALKRKITGIGFIFQLIPPRLI